MVEMPRQRPDFSYLFLPSFLARLVSTPPPAVQNNIRLLPLNSLALQIVNKTPNKGKMVILRAPSTLSTSTPSPSIPAPKLSWLSGTWNVTHSTLPMWKKSRNVRITYSAIAGTSPTQIDDTVTYQSHTSKKIKSVHGVDKPFSVPHTSANSVGAAALEAGIECHTDDASMAYNWRGKGWLMIASSKWEILGHGEEEGEGEGPAGGVTGETTNGDVSGDAAQATKGANQWVVTYFAKTMFTPAGVDLYSRRGGLKPQTVENIKKELVALGGEVEKLAGELFEVKMDGDRDD